MWFICKGPHFSSIRGWGREDMRDSRQRTAALLITLLSSMLAFPSVAAESAVTIDSVTSLGDADLGISALEDDGSGALLVVGADGYSVLVDSTKPTTQVVLETNRTEDLRDLSFHHGGNALIIGSGGVILRYVASDRFIEPAGGTSAVERTDLTAVEWNAAGSWAYIGGVGGWIWRYRADGDGGGEMHLLDGLRESDVTSIACHGRTSLCSVSTKADGVAVIDRDHELHWVGGSGTIWSDVECPTNDLDRCLATGAGRQMGLILLDEDDPAETGFSAMSYSEVSGEFTDVCIHEGNRVLIAATPFALIEYDIQSDALYPWLNHSDAAAANGTVVGSPIVCSWAEGRDTGFALTSRGDIVHFHPPEQIDPFLASPVTWLIALVIIVCVPGVILGLLYMNSPKMQSMYLAWRRRRRRAVEQVDSGPAARRRTDR